MAAPRLGDLERSVMDQLWSAESSRPGGLTVREVQEALGTVRDLAYTTVMTVLDRLAKKDLVARERDGRAWRYTALASREKLTALAMRQSLGDLDSSDRKSAMLAFLDDASPEELDDLRAALAAMEERS